MHRKLRRDLDPININFPKLPEKKYLFNLHPEFIESRLRALHEYLKSIILIYEALENPILQRFLEIDTTYDPNFEYLPIEFAKPVEKIFQDNKRPKVTQKKATESMVMSNDNKLEMKKKTRKSSGKVVLFHLINSHIVSQKERQEENYQTQKCRNLLNQGRKLAVKKRILLSLLLQKLPPSLPLLIFVQKRSKKRWWTNLLMLIFPNSGTSTPNLTYQ